MTSNATYLNIIAALRARQLVEVHPLRRLIVTPEMDSLLKGGKPQTGFRHYRADFLFGTYAAGYLVTVSLVGNSKAKPDLERLKDIDEVWALCFREPRPGWRFIGRFAQRDQFVGLRAYDRHALGSRAKYHKHAEEVVNDWKLIVGDLEPHRGSTVSDYLSGVWRDVDQKT